MSASGLLAQLLNGLASASSLFLVSVGLSLIFGVTRTINFAHGSFYMLGAFIAYSSVDLLSPHIGFWPALLLAPLACGALGALTETLLLRRIYKAPELFQLLATFALVLVIKDAALWLWGPEELFGPRATGLEGSVEILGRQFPTYDLFLIAVGPCVLLGLTLLLTRTRFGTLVRAATQDREMVGALGVNQAWLFTAVFALGTLLAGLGGALQLPREPASLEMDMLTIGAAFVVVVVGGMGSIPGAFIAALLVAELKAVCIWLGVQEIAGFELSFSKLTLVVEFLVMAVVLIWRPWGLLGKPQALARNAGEPEQPLRRSGRGATAAWLGLLSALVLLPLTTGVAEGGSYATVLLADIFVAALFASSLHFILGPGGMHSFGHAAYFGLGAYGAALLVRTLDLPMEAALLLGPLAAAAGALLYGWFCVRLSGVYLTMLTLAFAQISWAIVFQWDDFTGGSNGLTGVWPPDWASQGPAFYWLALGICALGIYLLRRLLFSPLGYALRASRDSALRADAIGIDVRRIQWTAFVIAGLFAGLAGALFAFSKGGVAPDTMSVTKSVDALVMVLLGGVQTLAGPVVGAAAFTWLHDTVARNTEYWRALMGATMLILVLLAPQGIAGYAQLLWSRTCGKVCGKDKAGART
ncbi:ABC transporter permease [Comamonas thiooxydans]|uniref:ABC transporter permease n=1 Tax=Comamonas thiooxydans TaxID=363952 RepID=A0AA42PXE3_9BURK|nr:MULTISPECIES: ABC transporter permease [Comamonas]EFI59171.1 High-affinity branched-chain amino acidtransport system permease protein livM [Comamonas thiooxydans]MDH1332531.1 ABC transporter permease [Comamonas thiooxydans]MDH1739542.1 ABC transporter permease [Comamonas thiooxydans]MDH1784958.1 ABC transporter permease [Comamonas thiooxydans]TFF60850.1 ABC transporter permease [Comamonas sp. A23]